MLHDIKNIHMIGVCGVGMGSLAGMLKSRGYRVSGSDQEVYPPMSDMLKGWGVSLSSGYDAARVDSADLVIIGNGISRGNPEAERVLESRIPYRSMAQALYDFFLEGREIIAVAGTHGKTTTTALLAHIFETAGLSPSFFVGGVPKNYGSNFRLGEGRYFIIEGDEYDSAFFEKLPKVIIYRPHHLVLTSLEFDHADIYKNLDEIKLWFKRLVNIIPRNGRIVYSAAYPALIEVLAGSRTQKVSFGEGDADCRYETGSLSGETVSLAVHTGGNGRLALRTGLMGEFNMANIAAAVAMAEQLGIDREPIERAVESFQGVRRRQELIYHKGNLFIYEDFAHHPTAIRGVCAAMRERFPDARLWVVYEPRSATSRRNVFQGELAQAFGGADAVLIKSPYKLDSIPQGDRIDIGRVIEAMRESGMDSHSFEDVDSIIAHIFSDMDSKGENVILIMSNGEFDGIYGKMIERAGR